MIEGNRAWRSVRLLAGAGLFSVAAAALASACGSGAGDLSGGRDAGADGSLRTGTAVQRDTLEILRSVEKLQKAGRGNVAGALRRHADRLIPRMTESGSAYRIDVQASARVRDALRIAPIAKPKLALTWTPAQGSNAEAEITQDGRAVFHKANGTADVVRTLTTNGIQESLVIRDAMSPNVYQWKVELPGTALRPVSVDDATVLVDEKGVGQIKISAARIVDAYGKEQTLPITINDGYATLLINHARAAYPMVATYSLTVPTEFEAFALAPTQIKARVMVLLDTSGSMLWGFADSNSRGADGDNRAVFCDNDLFNGSDTFHCTDNVACSVAAGGRPVWRLADVNDPSRMYAAKEALSNVVNAHSGLLDFGLERYSQEGGNNACPNTTYCCTPATGGSTRGRCKGVGGYTNFSNSPTNNNLTYSGGCGSSSNGGVILVQPGIGSGAATLPWTDHVEDFCANASSAPRNPELRADGSTPLARAVQSAITNWYKPIYTASKTSPNPASPLYDSQIDCRPYVFVVMTDGDDTCGTSTSGDPSDTVGAMRAVSATNPVTVYTLGMGSPAGLDTTELNQMAVAGGTGPTAPIAQNQTEIEAAFADIVAKTVKYETCNDKDDNCNALIDEGLGNYQECTIPSQCGSGTCNQGRCTCTTSNQCASGNTCTNGFCRPSCSIGVGACRKDGVRKCDAGGASQCCVNDGSASCTALTAGTGTAEICNGKDDDCNGIIDDVPGGCQGCVPFPEICNGVDDDCNGVKDDNLTDTGKSCGSSVGVCTPGTTACQNAGTAGATLICSGGTQPGTEVCNGKDDDCDGVVDGMTFSCYTGLPLTTQDVGICHGGTQQCTAVLGSGVDTRGPCVGQVTPGSETCNGLDDNCNGIIDDVAGVGTTCCSSGKCGTGICVAGTKQCSGGSLVCIGEILPGTEVCNGFDDDCNSKIDDVPNVNTTCCPSGSCGTGVCTAGTQVCQGNQLVCVNATGPGPEVCDNTDNDCNGTKDDVPGAGQSCCPTGVPCGVGLCKNGTLQCGAGSQQLQCLGSTGPVTEVCDTLDNDCNGTVDDVTGAGQPCCTSGKCGVGICVNGTQRCKGNALACTNETLPGTEVCDKLDNDCNGTTDDVPGKGTSCCQFQSNGTNLCGTGVCTNGSLQCSSSGPALVCQGGTGPSAEICDGLDNNCNGVVDDLPSGTVGGSCCPSGRCGTGVCTTGTLACSGTNTLSCQGATGPSTEICDNLDNDCNGTKDDVPGKGTTCCPAGVACGTGICKGGTLQCGAGSTQLTCTGFTGPATETCNGLDDDCNGLVDDVAGAGVACCTSGKCGTGVCKSGVQKCVGTALTCVNEVLPSSEVCNQLDDDCNGQVDDVSGKGTTCCPFKDGTGKDLCGVGVCAAGQQQCVPGQVTLKCTNAVGPGRELCDALDNDCNGIVDDLPGGTVGGTCCPSGKCGVGVCTAGTLRCGTTGIECAGAVNPTGEICDGLDNDCNGKVDDVPGIGSDCCPSGLCGRGACKAGKLVCGANGPVCQGAVEPSTETCNGIDDNCNGIVDDIPGLNQACCPAGSPPGTAPEACNKGVCRPGVTKCDGNQVACVGGHAPDAEVCDGQDNDCDGTVDETADVAANDPTIGVACDAPVAPKDKPPCKPGTTICQGARAVCKGAVGPGTEVCNGVDEDCDGVVDVGASCPPGKGCAEGACRVECTSGEFPCPGGQVCRNNFCIPTTVGTGGTGTGGTGTGGTGTGGTGTGGTGTGGTGTGGTAGSSAAGGTSAGGVGGTGTGGSAGSAASGGTSSGGTGADGGLAGNGAGGTSSGGTSAGGTQGVAGAAGTSNGKNFYGLATGGGGCACEVEGRSRNQQFVWASVLLALGVASRRRSRRAA